MLGNGGSGDVSRADAGWWAGGHRRTFGAAANATLEATAMKLAAKIRELAVAIKQLNQSSGLQLTEGGTALQGKVGGQRVRLVSGSQLSQSRGVSRR